MNRYSRTIAATAALAAVGLAATGCTAGSGGASQSIEAAGTAPPMVGADKATQVTMNISNTTGEIWNLTSATDSGTWQDRATATLGVFASETVSNYSGGDAEITVVYTGAQSGATYTFTAETPLVGSNSADGTTTNPAYRIVASVGGGYDPTDNFSTDGTENYSYTGATTTYTVPAGVTRLHVTADGGGSVDSSPPFYSNPSHGAQVDGELPVSPAQVLTIGIGGTGSNSTGQPVGGWGMTNGSNDYSGGSASGWGNGGGGGATVVVDQDGDVLLVAGGGGGGGGPQGVSGGDGGYDGSLTGQNGGPNGQGGAAGANTTSQGQSLDNSGDGAPSGPGGGGYRGGLAGPLGAGPGGGAGSSYLGSMNGTTVSTASATTGGLMLVPDAVGSTPARGSVPVRP